MSQRLVCCCEPNPCAPCNGLPQTVTIEPPPIIGINPQPCFAGCNQFPGNPDPYLPFVPPAVTAYLCTRGSGPTLTYLYRSTPIFAGSILNGYGGFGGPPCKSIDHYYCTQIDLACDGGYPSGVSWNLIYFLAYGEPYGTGFCEQSSNCVIVPNNFASNPCGGYFVQSGPSAQCPPGPLETPRAALQGIRQVDAGGNRYDLTYGTMIHQDALNPSPVRCVDPRAEYYGLEPSGNTYTVRVS